MTHPGVGPLTSLAFALTIGEVEPLPRAAEQVSSYLGLESPAEVLGGSACEWDRSASRAVQRRAGCWSKPGRRRHGQDAELRRLYQRLKFRRGSQIAKVAVARRLAVRLYWMLRSRADYGELLAQLVRLPGSSSSAVVPEAVDPSRR